MTRLERWHIDWPLLTGVLLLCGLSLVLLYSAGGENLSMLVRQGLRIGAALAAMLVVAQIPPAALMRWSAHLFAAGLVLLCVVLLVGVTGKGAQRWLDLGVVRFQPAEVMKLAVPMAVAWLLSRQALPPRWRDLMLACALIVVPAVLIAMQPDLGTAIMITASGLWVIFLAGVGWRLIAAVAVAGASAAPVLWFFYLHDYQRQRILTLFDPWADPLGAGYHIIQSTIAVGSGGLFGKGWLNGSQSQLEFIPERATDFIFAVYGEEFGFLGVLALLAVYLFIVVRGLMIANAAKNSYSRLLAGALSLTMFFYVFVNISMVSGILPVVGVPLPLISYGGTSMVTLMAGFGIIMSIQTHQRLMAH
jgi:rod shape determining protein RodA